MPPRQTVDALRDLLKQSAKLRAEVGTGYKKAGAVLYQRVSELTDDVNFAAQLRGPGSRAYIEGQAEHAKSLLGRLLGAVDTGEGAAPEDPMELQHEAAETLDTIAEEFATREKD